MKGIKKLLFLLVISVTSINLALASVNINTAGPSALSNGLKGVGLKKAQAIVAYRKAHGPFHSVAGLERVKGIGPKTVQRNRNNMTTGHASAKKK